MTRIALFIPDAADYAYAEWPENATAAKLKGRPGRPRGPSSGRKIIDLPDGDRLVPLFTTFSEMTGLHPKTLQRLRHKLPCTMIGGVAYVRDRAARTILAQPAKPRRGRLR
jgi:hypothetical protein